MKPELEAAFGLAIGLLSREGYKESVRELVVLFDWLREPDAYMTPEMRMLAKMHNAMAAISPPGNKDENETIPVWISRE